MDHPHAEDTENDDEERGKCKEPGGQESATMMTRSGDTQLDDEHGERTAVAACSLVDIQMKHDLTFDQQPSLFHSTHACHLISRLQSFPLFLSLPHSISHHITFTDCHLILKSSSCCTRAPYSISDRTAAAGRRTAGAFFEQNLLLHFWHKILYSV